MADHFNHHRHIEREREILRIARRNRWTLCYVAIVTTALFIVLILESTGRLN